MSGGATAAPGLMDPYAYLLYMLVAAAGFSTAENLGYLFMTPDAAQHNARPDCVPPPNWVKSVENLLGRLLLAYPLHLACGALTGLQLIRHHLAEEKLPLYWVLVPAILTHGTYDTVLFVLATLFPDVGGGTSDGAPEPADAALDLILIPVGWLYLSIPLFWLRHKLKAADMPKLVAAASAHEDRLSAMFVVPRPHELQASPQPVAMVAMAAVACCAIAVVPLFVAILVKRLTPRPA